ncbi:MAG TPA: hypothetical protein VJT33_09505, partial [bacterium]|nr:hypothetical protein [bacterium]
KVHEEVYRATFTEAVRHFSTHPPRGEFTLVIEGTRPELDGRAEDTAAAGALRESSRALARETMTRASAEGCSAQEAVRRAVEASGLRRNEVYRLWVALKQEAGQ